MGPATDTQRAQYLDDYVGMKVEATDGRAGKVVKDTYDVDKDHFVVRASRLGKRYELPGDVIIAAEDDVLLLGISKEELKQHPRYVDGRRKSGGGAAGPDRVLPL